jgi:ATP diphosphatase
MARLRDELGDLLLQVVFHARMAEEAGHFAFQDVAAAISAKLETRHPHIFGDMADDGQGQTRRWEALKAAEREAKGATSALDGVALALPALMRAEKLQKRAARVGFDWPDPTGPAEKVREELQELAEADDASRPEEAGDLLFAAVNLVRAHGVAPEDALRAANAKFETRFRAMEAMAAAQSVNFAALDLDSQEELWRAVKALERQNLA